MLPPDDLAKFDLLARAFRAGRAALVRIRNPSDGAPSAAVCAVLRDGRDHVIVPVAVLVEGNPFEPAAPPAGGMEAAAPPGPPVEASETCTSCGSPHIGTLQSLSGIALGSFEEGRFEWSGTTEVDWSGSETVRTPDGATMACASCGGRWIHPALVLEGD